MGKAMREYKKELKRAMKRERALLLTVYLGFTLMGFTLVSTTFAEPWFSESRYGYFIGEINSWDGDWATGIVCVAPENTSVHAFGDDPHVVINFDNIRPGSTEFTGYSKQVMFYSSIVNFSMIELNYNEMDLYIEGTLKISASVLMCTRNVTDVADLIAELNVVDIAIITPESNIADITDFATELDIGVTVFYITEENKTDVRGSCSNGSSYIIIGDEEFGPFDADIYYEEPMFQVNVPRQSLNPAPGQLYVTGNWTDFVVEINGFGVLSGKVLDYVVEYEPESTVSVARTDVNHNRKIDINDIAVVAYAYGSTTGSPRYDPNLDFNSDSIINIIDLAIVARNFGKTY